MDDLEDWSLLEERLSSPSSPPPPSPLEQSGSWETAEEATRGIVAQVQPTRVSEERREAVIDYVHRLIKTTLGCEVFPFGSVPLKTYLPDGDIDLTAFGGLHLEEALANEVCSVLEREDQNGAAQFVVKDVQVIRAEVKLVKCLVQNIVVDISFNQLGGLNTLCFLEKVDRCIGKDHLFKRSIILIKAWCYYESRILGAHHGLISTYALETLVLYIFHLFHSSLDGPLAVLYKFLDYFSKFDWDKYCISLNGLVRLSSLPDVVVEKPENGGGDLLLTSDFFKDCLPQHSVPLKAFEANLRSFPSKHLNIVDPLRVTNNLGRSVSKGNFYRIRSAFTYGARQLRWVLSQAEEDITSELRKFFSNTLDRHGSGQRPDVLDSVPLVRYNGYRAISPVSSTDLCEEGQSIYESESSVSGGHDHQGSSGGHDHEGSSYLGVNNLKTSRTANMSISKSQGHTDPCVSQKLFVGDAKDLAILRIQRLDISNDASKSLHVSGKEDSSLPSSKPCLPRHMRNGVSQNGNMEQKRQENSSLAESKAFLDISPMTGEGKGHCNGNQNLSVCQEGLSNAGSMHPPSATNLVTWPQEDIYLHHSGHGVSAKLGRASVTQNLLSDLTGDYDSHLNSLYYGRWWFDHVQNGPLSPLSPPVLSQFQSNSSWEVVRRALPFGRNMVSPINADGGVPRQVFFPMNPPIMPSAGFVMDEMQKPRGTGTYFPNANHYRDRPFSPRGRNQHPARSPRNNGRTMAFSETNSWEKSNREQQFYAHLGGAKNGSYEVSRTPENPIFPDANGSAHPPEKAVEIGHSSPESNKQLNLSIGSYRSPGSNRQKAIPSMHQDRVRDTQSYHLTNEDDFPPLST